jgi:AraC-like DNA-binding protein
MVNLQTYIPEALSPFVKSFWRLEVTDTGMPYEEDILPDGHHEIIFHLNAYTAKRRTEQESWLYEPDAFFAGQTLQSYTIQLSPGAIMYGIRFYPHTLSLLFGLPAAFTTNQLLSLDDVPGARMLKTCITENAAQTFSNFEKALSAGISRLQPAGGFRYVEASVAAILRQKGDVRIDRLISETGISRKYLNTAFRQFVGVSPKTLCNIIKLNYFINYRKSHLSRNLTSCSYEANFYDQSHLIKLFRTFTGKSPRVYFNDAHYISEHFTAL